MPTADGLDTGGAYQPGGTSRYEGATGGYVNRNEASANGGNPYADQRSENRYQEPPINSRDGAARY